MLSQDGGAHSIAGIDVDVEGGQNIIAIFSQWGVSQLMLAIIQSVVVFKYTYMIPLIYGLLMVEYGLRMAVGEFKHLETTHPPPGKFANYIMIPLAFIGLVFSLIQKK